MIFLLLCNSRDLNSLETTKGVKRTLAARLETHESQKHQKAN